MNSMSLLSWQARTMSAMKMKEPFSTPEKQGIFALEALVELVAHLLHARFELLLGIQYLQDVLIHIALSHSFFLHFLFIRICCI